MLAVKEWNHNTRTVIEGSFYLGYALTQLPGGYLSEKFGSKHVIGFGFLLTSVFTIFLPLIIKLSSGNWLITSATMMIIGSSQGVIYPSIMSLLGQWITSSDRTTVGGMVYSGSAIGALLSNLAGPALMKTTQSWSVLLYIYGGIGLVWYISWILLCYSSPSTCPLLHREEKEYLELHLGKVLRSTN